MYLVYENVNNQTVGAYYSDDIFFGINHVEGNTETIDITDLTDGIVWCDIGNNPSVFGNAVGAPLAVTGLSSQEDGYGVGVGYKSLDFVEENLPTWRGSSRIVFNREFRNYSEINGIVDITVGNRRCSSYFLFNNADYSSYAYGGIEVDGSDSYMKVLIGPQLYQQVPIVGAIDGKLQYEVINKDNVIYVVVRYKSTGEGFKQYIFKYVHNYTDLRYTTIQGKVWISGSGDTHINMNAPRWYEANLKLWWRVEDDDPYILETDVNTYDDDYEVKGTDSYPLAEIEGKVKKLIPPNGQNTVGIGEYRVDREDEDDGDGSKAVRRVKYPMATKGSGYWEVRQLFPPTQATNIILGDIIVAEDVVYTLSGTIDGEVLGSTIEWTMYPITLAFTLLRNGVSITNSVTWQIVLSAGDAGQQVLSNTNTYTGTLPTELNGVPIADCSILLYVSTIPSYPDMFNTYEIDDNSRDIRIAVNQRFGTDKLVVTFTFRG